MIVVTGPNGNVGTELVRMLANQGDLPFRIAAHTPAKIKKLYGEAVRVATFSYQDRSTWAATLDGVSTLFLLFPLPHWRTAKEWMVPFVEAAAKAGCQHIIYVSVPGADTVKTVPHYTVERAIEASGVPYTFLRAAYFSQNLCRDITTHAVDIAQRGEIFIPAGRGKTSFIDSRDVAEVAIKIMRDPAPHRNQAYVLTGPTALDMYQAAEIFSDVLGRPIRYPNPSMLAFWLRLGRRMNWDTLVFMTIVYGLTRLGRNAPLTDTLGRLLGRPPATLKDFVLAYRNRFEGEAATRWVRVHTPGLARKM